jgi:antibiotic biosynthesis monooxygenase (ABM) superfamily enzyme
MTNHKQLSLMFGIWLFVYPLVTALLYLIRTFGSFLPVPEQTLIATLILVPLMINWIAPFVKNRIDQL